MQVYFKYKTAFLSHTNSLLLFLDTDYGVR